MNGTKKRLFSNIAKNIAKVKQPTNKHFILSHSRWEVSDSLFYTPRKIKTFSRRSLSKRNQELANCSMQILHVSFIHFEPKYSVKNSNLWTSFNSNGVKSTHSVYFKFFKHYFRRNLWETSHLICTTLQGQNSSLYMNLLFFPVFVLGDNFLVLCHFKGWNPQVSLWQLPETQS